jgi:hypothetical protein
MRIENLIDDEPKEGRSPRGRLLVAFLGAVVALALIAAIVLWCSPPAAVRDATQLLTQMAPNFEPSHYRARITNQSADGRFYRVVFNRISGGGRESYTVNVPKRRFQRPLDGLLDFFSAKSK